MCKRILLLYKHSFCPRKRTHTIGWQEEPCSDASVCHINTLSSVWVFIPPTTNMLWPLYVKICSCRDNIDKYLWQNIFPLTQKAWISCQKDSGTLNMHIIFDIHTIASLWEPKNIFKRPSSSSVKESSSLFDPSGCERPNAHNSCGRKPNQVQTKTWSSFRSTRHLVIIWSAPRRTHPLDLWSLWFRAALIADACDAEHRQQHPGKAVLNNAPHERFE